MANSGVCWLISDTHFGHGNVLTFKREDGSPLRDFKSVEEMGETMVERWNSVVGKNDRVYHLGDVVINRKYLPILDRLNGRKVLVKGNHCIFKLSDYAKYFDDIRAYHKLDNFILSHIPIHPDSLARWCDGNLHGHLHSNRVMLNGEIDKRYFNVSVEQINYTPISFEDVKKACL